MRKELGAVLLAFAAFNLPAETTVEPERQEIFRLGADARVDYQRLYNDGDAVDSESGFKGRYFLFRVDGNITDNISYSWRQRLNVPKNQSSFFDATDWLYVDYHFGNWSLSGGKEVVKIGGWEYDRAPIDLYSCSLFWQNVGCFQFGTSLGYSVTPADKIAFQLSQSMFHTKEDNDMYGYSLMWSGKHGIYSPLWSVNLFEYAPGHYINYISLGNRFDVGRFTLEVDFMNRAASHQTFLFRDMTLIGELSFRPTQKWNIFGKMTYDVNKTDSPADLYVLSGTELKMAGGGVEYMPLLAQHNALRLHFNCFYSWGTNKNVNDMMQNKSLIFDVGIKFHIDLLSFKRK